MLVKLMFSQFSFFTFLLFRPPPGFHFPHLSSFERTFSVTLIGFQQSGDFDSYCPATFLASPVAQSVLLSVRVENIREERGDSMPRMGHHSRTPHR